MSRLLKFFGYKKIKCIRCKLLVRVRKGHHRLKICPKCQEKVDGLGYLLNDLLKSMEAF